VSACDVTEEVPVLLGFFGAVVFIKPEFCNAVLRTDCKKLEVIPPMLHMILLSAF
jgi:hypothetical protein